MEKISWKERTNEQELRFVDEDRQIVTTIVSGKNWIACSKMQLRAERKGNNAEEDQVSRDAEKPGTADGGLVGARGGNGRVSFVDTSS